MAARPPSSESESRWGGPRTILALVLAGAAALRLAGVAYGLPYGNLLDPDEENIVPRAWAITHGGGLDPHPFFDYPSLLFYVLAPFQAWQPEPSYLTARLVVVAIGLAGVAAAWWLGERAYGVVAGGVAAVVTAVATVHVAYSRTAVTDVLLTTLVTVALALLVSGRIELAGLAAGFAFAAKQPGVLLAVPLVVAAWGRWRRLAGAAALALCGFAAATPFVLVHLGEAAGDWWRVQSRVRAGWLGFEHDHSAPVAFVDRLWESLGPALVVAALGLVVALARRAPADRILASFALAYYLSLLPLGAHFDRYVLPIVPVLGVLAGKFRPLVPFTLLLLVVPLTWTIRDDRELLKTDTRVVAARRYATLEGPLALDPSLPVPEGLDVVRLPLPAPWAEFDPLRHVQVLRGRGVRYVVLTGAIENRVLAARGDYPLEARFYDNVTRGPEVERVEPDDDLAGPWVAVYRLASH